MNPIEDAILRRRSEALAQRDQAAGLDAEADHLQAQLDWFDDEYPDWRTAWQQRQREMAS